jgi:REP element-mobilizing transposase RayT
VPRAPRDLAPGPRHLWVNATGDELYFRDETDRMDWIRLLVTLLERRRWTCIAFCQLGTHLHLIVDVPDQSLAVGMKWLNAEYSRDFNARHGRNGQFVRCRYGSSRIRDGSDLLRRYLYVVLNAVMAGLCPRPEDWRWSSYATSIGLSSDFLFVDASLAIAEAGGSTDGLAAAAEARLRELLSVRVVSGV